MPYITIEGGMMSAEQKRVLIEQMTAVASEITRIPKQFFLVTLKELPDENIGIGGELINEIKKRYE
ncbi:MAG: tautomerase family protein [Alistipes sp.]|nr:tautomerase family protein [Alistipes sp.]